MTRDASGLKINHNKPEYIYIQREDSNTNLEGGDFQNTSQFKYLVVVGC